MRLVLIACLAALAFGQTNREFQLSQNRTQQELNELAVLLRAVVDLPQPSVDEAKQTVTVAGTTAQFAMAEWLVRKLDLPSNAPPAGVHEYRSQGESDDIVRVFYASQSSTPEQLREMLANMRSLSDIRRLHLYLPLQAMVVRGNSREIALTAWLMEQLDRPVNSSPPQPREYPLPGDDIVRIFELTYPQSPQQLQEIAVLIRSVGDIRRLFSYRARRELTVRASSEQIEFAAWLVGKLDQPLDGSAVARDASAKHEFRLSSSPDNLVRVFYFPGSLPLQQFREAAIAIRKASGSKYVFAYSALRALAWRGTAEQVTAAEQVIAEMKAQ